MGHNPIPPLPLPTEPDPRLWGDGYVAELHERSGCDSVGACSPIAVAARTSHAFGSSSGARRISVSRTATTPLAPSTTERDLPVVRACAVASLQYEAWLQRIGTTFGDRDPHPMEGIGTDSCGVAEVLFHDETDSAYWRRRMYAHGLASMMQLDYDTAHNLTMLWLAEAPRPTPSEVGRTIAMLKRAERLGLVTSQRLYGKLWWLPVP